MFRTFSFKGSQTRHKGLLLIHRKSLEWEVSLRTGLSPHQLTHGMPQAHTLSSERYSSPLTQKEQNILVTEDSEMYFKIQLNQPAPSTKSHSPRDIPSKVMCGKGPLTQHSSSQVPIQDPMTLWWIRSFRRRVIFFSRNLLQSKFGIRFYVTKVFYLND